MTAPAHGPDPRPDPVLITEAAPSLDDQLAARKRKYVIMMVCRIPCLVLAGLTYHTWWLAIMFLVISVPLPWVAVLIANDRPPRKTEKVNRFSPDAKKIEHSKHQVIDG
ncbi:DUF3099 domain-containing protein [Amycolatopsis benzoatilytica]|uniref:DUF3099 domain-containing protein n=1 Tax=Amycolatopsis benzoatilytica TaxID=346045 RepID=UPI0003A3455D